METMQGTCHIYKADRLLCAFFTLRYDSTNKSAAHIQGAIVRQVKRRIKDYGADYADVYIHYSMLPVGPNCTRGMGRGSHEKI